MRAFGSSQGGTRREDLRFLTGTGRYIADTLPEGALHAAFLRAPVAHARITALMVEDARAMPGVRGIWTGADLAGAGVNGPLWSVAARDQRGMAGASPPRPVLAEQVMRHMGEPVALVVATSRAAAQDAIEAIGLEFDELPVHLANAPGGAAIHPQAPGNLAYDWRLGDPDALDAAFAGAAHITRLTLRQERLMPASMEPRAAFAEWDGTRLHLAFNGQGVWILKRELARMLGLAPDQVRVTIPDVGGGFGMKAMIYPEHFAIAHGARSLAAPIAWLPDRAEAMLSDNAARDLTSTAEMAFDADHRIIGYRVTNRSNLGAYNSQFGQNIQSEMFAKVFTGVYDIPAALLNAQGIYTNTTPVDAYRGAGRPEAITLIERVMDLAARELGLSPFDLRRRNFIAPGQFPYPTASGMTYDTGDFARVLERARVAGDAAGFAARRAHSAARGRLRGLGLSYYIESILGEDSETAAVEFLPGGGVNLYVGTQSNGQGHETVYARYLANLTGLNADNITVVQGDSDRIARGGGTGGSRSVTVQTLATHGTVVQMVEAFADFLQETLAASPFQFIEGIFQTPGSNHRLTLAEAVDLARTAGRTDLMRHEKRSQLPGRSFPNGAHLCEVEIDPETGALSLEKYLAFDDFGNLMHPVMVQGQVHGGVAQGFGQAVCEAAAFDEQGQLLTGSFMDYAMPRATDLPMIGFENLPTPSPNNPMGMKGCGEAGTVGAIAVIANAALDALWPEGVRDIDMPLTPLRIWTSLQKAKAGISAA